jgi:septum formation inhibitor-activating ATPase MinD
LAGLQDRRCDLVVRLERPGAISPAAAAENLGRPLLGTVPSSSALVAMADRGVPPGSGGARAWAKACRRLVERLEGVEASRPRDRTAVSRERASDAGQAALKRGRKPR